MDGLRGEPRLKRTLIPGRSDIIFARNWPEGTTDTDLAAITRLIERYDDGRRLVTNPQSSFLLADSKDRSYDAWSRAGLQCPRHWVLETDPEDPADPGCVEQALALLETHPRILLRTNNEWEGRNMHFVDRETPADRVREILLQLKEHVAWWRRKRGDMRILVVEYVDTRDAEGYGILARAYVVLDHVFNYHVVVGDGMNIHMRDMTPECYERWLEANREVRRMLADPAISAEIVRAVTSLGNNIGGLDFLVREGKPVFLELNPMWGGTHGGYDFGNEDLRHLLEKTEDRWSKELPNVVENLDVVEFYRRMYTYIADYAERWLLGEGMR
jgi:biotin carboxylase